jgi:hypothetical protein
MLVGYAGCGKTQLMSNLLLKQREDPSVGSITINFNYFTNSALLQTTLEAPLDKRSGSTYGPAGAHSRILFFLDDLNLPEVRALGRAGFYCVLPCACMAACIRRLMACPGLAPVRITAAPHPSPRLPCLPWLPPPSQVDKYNTQSAIALLRQHVDYGHWYDRTKLTPKIIQDCQYVAALNPSVGSFFINPRLQVRGWPAVWARPSAAAICVCGGLICAAPLGSLRGTLSPPSSDICGYLLCLPS